MVFENVNLESVEKAVDVKPTFPLPKVGDSPMSYEIVGEPFEIETPNSKYNKTAMKMQVKHDGMDGEIFVSSSLEFQIAVSMKRLGIEPKPKNFSKIIGKFITIWMETSISDGNSYYHCQINDENPNPWHGMEKAFE